jgi:hypothetical protein
MGTNLIGAKYARDTKLPDFIDPKEKEMIRLQDQ